MRKLFPDSARSVVELSRAAGRIKHERLATRQILTSSIGRLLSSDNFRQLPELSFFSFFFIFIDKKPGELP